MISPYHKIFTGRPKSPAQRKIPANRILLGQAVVGIDRRYLSVYCGGCKWRDQRTGRSNRKLMCAGQDLVGGRRESNVLFTPKRSVFVVILP